MILSSLKQKSLCILEGIHLRIFRHEMGKEMREFLKDLSWSFIGGITASALMIAVNVGIGRYFGPEEYGKYNFVLILSQMLLVFVYLGTDISSVKFLAHEKEPQEKKIIFSSSLYFVMAMILVSWIMYYFAHVHVERYFHIGEGYIFSALILGSALAIKGIVDGYLRAYAFFRFQAILRIIEAIVIIGSLLFVLSATGVKEHQYYVYVLSGGAALFSLVTLFRLRQSFGTFNWASLKVLLAYGNIILIATVFGTIFNSLDKLIVAKYLGVTQLGIYSAYFMTSTNLIAQITQVFNNVFFPAISQVTHTAYIAKMNTLIRWLFVPAAIFLSAVLYVVVLIFGQAYQPSIFLATGFGFLSVLQIIFTINASIITALSKKLLKEYYFWLYGVSFCHLILYGVLIYFTSITIPALLLLFFINFTVMIIVQKNLINTFIKAKNS